MALTIYGIYRSRAARNIWAANELGLAFTHVPVIQVYRLPGGKAAPGAALNTQSPEFLKVNPNGLIPAIEDDGLVLHESLAINLYLARKAGGSLAPKDLGEEGLFTMWTLWAANTCEAQTLAIMQHRVAKPPAERVAATADAAVVTLKGPFAVLNAALAKDGYLVGGRFTIADLNVAEVIRYAVAAPELFAGAPHVKAWLEACQARPAFREMWARREAEPA